MTEEEIPAISAVHFGKQLCEVSSGPEDLSVANRNCMETYVLKIAGASVLYPRRRRLQEEVLKEDPVDEPGEVDGYRLAA